MYGWIQAMDEAMVASHLGIADEYDSYDTARRKLNELIDWHIAVATDPRVNGGWQLVPVEPTYNMLESSGYDVSIESIEAWQAMLAAAPTSSTTTTPP